MKKQVENRMNKRLRHFNYSQVMKGLYFYVT